MTEKRFILKENGLIEDIQLNILLDGGEDKEDMVDLLNEQHETIQQQKEAIEHLSYDCEYIQNTIKEAYNNERTHIGQSVLKQLLEAIQ